MILQVTDTGLALEKIGDVLHEMLDLLDERLPPAGRMYGQEAAATDDEPPLLLVRDQEDMVRLATNKIVAKLGSMREYSFDDVRDAMVKEITTTLRSVVDFRNDSEKKLAKAFGELSQLRRECNQAKLQGLKQARNLSVAVFAGDTHNAAFKKFIADLDQLVEMNQGGSA